eukprot:scaffold122510_cov56-Attheya_sp.AAC.1
MGEVKEETYPIDFHWLVGTVQNQTAVLHPNNDTQSSCSLSSSYSTEDLPSTVPAGTLGFLYLLVQIVLCLVRGGQYKRNVRTDARTRLLTYYLLALLSLLVLQYDRHVRKSDIPHAGSLTERDWSNASERATRAVVVFLSRFLDTHSTNEKCPTTQEGGAEEAAAEQSQKERSLHNCFKVLLPVISSWTNE